MGLSKRIFYKIAVCCDENTYCAQIEKNLLELSDKLNVVIKVEIFMSGQELIHYIELGERFDLIFLKWEMAGISGYEAGILIRQKFKDAFVEIAYIFTHKICTCEVIRVSPIDAIITPIDKTDVLRIVQKIIKKQTKNFHFFYYKLGHEYCKIQLEQIVYFESIGRKVKIVAKEEPIIEFYGTLKQINQELKELSFIRVHNSYIVNLYHIKKLSYNHIIMSNNQKINISPAKRKAIKSMVIYRKLHI